MNNTRTCIFFPEGERSVNLTLTQCNETLSSLRLIHNRASACVLAAQPAASAYAHVYASSPGPWSTVVSSPNTYMHQTLALCIPPNGIPTKIELTFGNSINILSTN